MVFHTIRRNGLLSKLQLGYIKFWQNKEGSGRCSKMGPVEEYMQRLQVDVSRSSEVGNLASSTVCAMRTEHMSLLLFQELISRFSQLVT